MTRKQAERYAHLLNAVSAYGLTRSDLDALLLAEKRLSRFAEHECNGVIQRDEMTGIPYWYSSYDNRRLGKARDMENGALKRIAEILKPTTLSFYHQTDPRGCALYLIRQSDIPDGKSIDQYYTRGIAICL